MEFRKEWLVNPFRRIAGIEALLAGFGFMLLSAVIAWRSQTHFDGVLDSHTGMHESPLWVYFAEPFLAWGCAVPVFGIVARIAAGTRFRLIDLAGTLALSRAPMLIAAILGFAVPADLNPASISPVILLLAIPMLGIAVWMVVLMFWAFKVSVNPTQGRIALLFTVSLVLAEVLSKFVFHAFYKTLVL